MLHPQGIPSRNPLPSGTERCHSLHLHELGRRGMHLHGHLEYTDDSDITFSDDLPERLPEVDSNFAQHTGRAIDAYIGRQGSTRQYSLPVSGWLAPLRTTQLNLAGRK